VAPRKTAITFPASPQDIADFHTVCRTRGWSIGDGGRIALADFLSKWLRKPVMDEKVGA
jgi:hypothetical protein